MEQVVLSRADPSPVRFSITLDVNTNEKLERICKAKGISKSKAVKDAIDLESFLSNLIEDNVTILLKHKGGKTKELTIK